jgi:hypothetical protein
MKVFLGGTVGDPRNDWREEFVKGLKIDFFNPVVDDWNDEAREREEKEKRESDFNLYVITPYMRGVYSIAELVDDSNKKPEKTIACFLKEYKGKSFDKQQWMSIWATAELVIKNGIHVFYSLEDTRDYLNNFSEIREILKELTKN